MPMNRVELLLSDTADYVEQRLQAEAGTRGAVTTELGNGQKPSIVRELKCITGAVLTIIIANKDA